VLPPIPGTRLRSGPLARFAAAALRAEAFVVRRTVFLSARGARAIAAGSEEGESLLAHELAHVAQYRRHGVLPFLRRYFAQYFAGRARGLSHEAAYASISFEREAEERAVAARLAFRTAESPCGRLRGA
jgi:hypothetical protein